MRNKRYQGNFSVTTTAWLLLLLLTLSGCGGSDSGPAPSLNDIPQYPNAAESESMQQSALGGMINGEVRQLMTTDKYDDVLSFYTDALSDSAPEVIADKSPMGQQTAFAIMREDGIISVTIQEFKKENQVAITLMSIGN